MIAAERLTHRAPVERGWSPLPNRSRIDIAARWADRRKVLQIAFAPDWTKHAKAVPFKRNDQRLDILPVSVMVFPGTGIQDNLAAKARKLGIPLFDFRKGGGA